MKQMSSLTNDEALAGQLLEGVDARCQQLLRGELEETMAEEDAQALGEQLKEPLEKSLKELDALLKENHPKWVDECGLVKTVAKDADGATEWVLQADVDEFKQRGRAMMGTGAMGNEGGATPQSQTLPAKTAKVAPETVAPAPVDNKGGCCMLL